MNNWSGRHNAYRFSLIFVLLLYVTKTLAHPNYSNSESTAPNWVLNDLHGKSVRLSDYKGKIVVLNFWATWCSTCRKELSEFVAMKQQFESKGVVIIGVAMDRDNVADVKAIVRQYFVNFPTVIATSSMLRDYGVASTPQTFIINRNGIVVFKHDGALSRETLKQRIAQVL